MAFGPWCHGQIIQFLSTPQEAQAYYAKQQPQLYGLCADSLRMDTIYTEDLSTGNLEMQVQQYPFARYEFYLDGALYRRVDIIEDDSRQDTTWMEDLETGDLMVVVQVVIKDIPNGVYHEFFPNGNIRVMGRLDGYNADGTLKKTGEWKEWDAAGKVIRREEYPE